MMQVRAIRDLGMGIVLSALVAGSTQGQSVGKNLVTHVSSAVGDVWGVWTAPVHSSGRDWLMAVGLVGGSAVLTIVDDNVDRWVVEHQNSSAWSPLKEVREGGIAFSGKYITPVAAGALVLGLATNNQRLQEGIFGCLSSYATTSIARNYVFYQLVGRTRPDSSRRGPESPPAIDGDQFDISFPGSSRWGEHSLPAGHVANITACASFLGNRFSMGLMEPVVYAVAAGVGVGRIVDRRHWLSDTVLGIVFGYAAGKEVALRSGRRADRAAAARAAAAAEAANGRFSISPGPGGITLSWQKTF
jgi:membrane-associated phospholipid phosphatase